MGRFSDLAMMRRIYTNMDSLILNLKQRRKLTRDRLNMEELTG